MAADKEVTRAAHWTDKEGVEHSVTTFERIGQEEERWSKLLALLGGSFTGEEGLDSTTLAWVIGKMEAMGKKGR